MDIPHCLLIHMLEDVWVHSSFPLLQSQLHKAVEVPTSMPLYERVFPFIRLIPRSQMPVLFFKKMSSSSRALVQCYIPTSNGKSNQILSINLFYIRSDSRHLNSKNKLPPLRPRKKRAPSPCHYLPVKRTSVCILLSFPLNPL